MKHVLFAGDLFTRLKPIMQIVGSGGEEDGGLSLQHFLVADIFRYFTKKKLNYRGILHPPHPFGEKNSVRNNVKKEINSEIKKLKLN